MTHAELVRGLVLGRRGPEIYVKLAAAAIAEKAGRLPERIQEGPVPASPDETPPASASASRILAAIVTVFPDVLPEWLARCRAAKRRARETDLPMLLERGRTTSRLRPSIAAVLGTRGRWLAGQNPAWGWALAAPKAAAVPDPGVSARMAERLRALVRRGKLQLPDACDEAMVRDGVKRSPPAGTGAKQFWLLQMVALAPPNALPAKLLLSDASLRSMGSRAALLHGDVDLAEELLRRAAAGDDGVDLALVELLPAGRRHALLLELLRAEEPEALSLVTHAPPTLPAELGRLALATAARTRYRGRLTHQLALRIEPVVDPTFSVLVVDQLPLLELRQRMHRELAPA